jgi:hypothetical protein
MKQLTAIITGLFILSLLLTGCKKDKDDDKDNLFAVEDAKYNLSWGLYLYWGTDSWYEGEGYQVYLCSADLDFSTDLYIWTGTGNRMLIEFISDSDEEISTGTYELETTEPLPVFTFDQYSYWETGYNTAENDGSYLASGTIKVKSLGDDKYEFIIDATDGSGNDVNGYFKGTLEYVDATLKNSGIPRERSAEHRLRAVRAE